MPERPPRSATASSAGTALAALELYLLHVARLAQRPVDAELYQTVAQDIATVRLACRELPQASTAWTGLLIAHAELMHGLWLGSRGQQPDLAGQLERVRENAQRVQAVCMRLAGPPG